MYRSSRITPLPWVACDPNGRGARPGCYPSSNEPPLIGHFSFAAIRSPAQAFHLEGARFRTPSLFSYVVEAVGIEPTSEAAPEKRLQA
jgi:hypothetical protein